MNVLNNLMCWETSHMNKANMNINDINKEGDLKSGGCGFKSSSDQQLVLSSVVPSSTPRSHL